MKKTHLTVVVALTAVLAGCEKAPGPTAAVSPALTHTVRDISEHALASFPGEVRARHEADLSFRVGGKLIERRVDAGARVRRGAVLARIDDSDVALSARAAAAQLAAALTDAENARVELERARSLAARNFVSGTVLDARQNAFKSASARLDQAKAQAELAANQSGYASLSAAHEGVITAVLAEPGQVVSAGQPVLRLARADEREIWITVPESRMGEMRGAGELVATLWTDPAKRYRARVREIAPQADPVTRSFLVKLTLLDADDDVRLGMTANVFLRQPPEGTTVSVPAASIGSREGRPVVWILGADNKVQPRTVEIRAYLKDAVVLAAGVSEGETIIAAGVHKLVPGQTVRPLAANGDRSAK